MSKSGLVAVVDRTTPEGFTERLGRLNESAPHLFARLLLPGVPRGVLVLVPTLASDRIRWWEPVRMLSTRLLEADIAMLSFDFRGEGLSDEWPMRTRETLVEDVASILDTAGELNVPKCVLGLGIGGLLAESTGLGMPTLSWGAPDSGREFFLALTRQKLLKQMGFDPDGETGLLDAVARDVVADELAGGGHLDLSGFLVERSLYDSLIDLRDHESVGSQRSFENDDGPDEVAEAVISALLPA